MSDYQKLRVWQAARSLAHDCYRRTAGFSPSELYGLQSQIRRAAMSIPTNLAEGSGRGSDRDFARFVRIARGSASELQSLLVSACEVGLLESDVAAELGRRADTVGKMLSGLARRLATSS